MGLSAEDEARLAVVSSRWELTPKEVLVLGAWAFTEQSVEQIASRHGNAVSTIRGHIRSIRVKARVHSRAELVRRIYRDT